MASRPVAGLGPRVRLVGAASVLQERTPPSSSWCYATRFAVLRRLVRRPRPSWADRAAVRAEISRGVGSVTTAPSSTVEPVGTATSPGVGVFGKVLMAA
jgi:hypothetical protein